MTGCTNEWRDTVKQALALYGACLAEGDHLAKGDKTFSLRVEVARKRLRVLGADGALIMSGPIEQKTICSFVERFWFWKRVYPCMEDQIVAPHVVRNELAGNGVVGG
ncbi:hypothetical protein HLH33_17675 [Gluconacetobacter diazotrophicus]|uniref:Uncharacterized protein n=1 Tax=Gluconacetobacter diazotrophicus TaxID=33996 RepID=A0A7W4I885_GLUDI|nr:hypothetical protein [Gluconacetobacter diazotrophicus]MBB2158103.1 hypothetical protein [Gluconacetobacter diazotrophicus]